jgi:hypothetical protein
MDWWQWITTYCLGLATAFSFIQIYTVPPKPVRLELPESKLDFNAPEFHAKEWDRPVQLILYKRNLLTGGYNAEVWVFTGNYEHLYTHTIYPKQAD